MAETPAPPSSGPLPTPPNLPLEDLRSDKLLRDAPRVSITGLPAPVPSLAGIPLLARVGRGGMGAVYYGVHPRLGKHVAIKVLPFHLADQQPELIERFQREARFAARVRSQHLVDVSDVNEEQGLHYIVMEYVHGVSAAGYLKEVKAAERVGLPESEALAIVIAATKGLAAAHAAGVVHRDVKPDNILIPRRAGGTLDFDAAKLADLGLARGEDGGATLTVTQAAMGTPGYMAPEQGMDVKSAGKPADLFGVGATLYALLSGRAPFKGSSPMQVMMETAQAPHIPIASYRQDLQEITRSVVNRCLEKRPEDRYPDSLALLADLERARSVCLGHTPAPPTISELAPTMMKPSSLPGTQPMPPGASEARKPGRARRLKAKPDPESKGAAPARGAGVALVLALLLCTAGGGVWWWTVQEDGAATPEGPGGRMMVSRPANGESGGQKTTDPAEPGVQHGQSESGERPGLRPPAGAAEEGEDDPRTAIPPPPPVAPAELPAKKISPEEARATLNLAIQVATDAQKKEEWERVVLALQDPLEALGAAEHPLRAMAEGMLRQAQANLERERQFERKLAEASKLFLEGKHALAEAAYAAALEAWPDVPAERKRLVEEGLAKNQAAQKIGALAAAKHAMEDALKDVSKDEQGTYRNAPLALRNRILDAALDVLALDPNDARAEDIRDAATGLRMLLVDTGHWDATVSDFGNWSNTLLERPLHRILEVPGAWMSFQGAAKSIKLWRRWEGEAGWKVRFDGPVMRLEVAEKAIGDDLLLFADPSSVAGIDATGEEGRKALLALPKGTKLYSAGVANLEDPAIVEALRNARVEALTVSDGGDLASLWRLPTVRLLDLGGEVKSLAPMASLQNLEAFYFRCRALEGEETLSQLPNLKDIAILHYKTKEIGFLRNLRSLRSLVFSRLIKTEIMADLTGLTNLESLSVGYLTDSDLGVNLEATSQVLGRLRRLRCYGGGAKHQDFPKLAPHLIGLKWSYAEASEFASMAGLRGLSTLALQNCENAKDFSALGALRHLRYLSVSRNPQLESLAFVENLPKLRYLSVLGCKVLADLKPIRGLREIESLVLEHCPLIADLEPLLGLTRLRALYFNGCSRVKVEELFKVLGRSSADQGRYLRVISLPQVVGEKELEMLANSWNFSSPGTLVLQDMPNLTRLDALVSGPKYIHVNNCLGIKTLDLSALAATNEIFLFACTQLQSLAVDEKKAKTLRLESLRIHGCRQLKDIECLKHASSLRNLELDECLSLASEQIIAVAKALPRCRVMVGNLSSMEEKFEAKLMLSEANRLRHEARIVFGAVDNPRINELYRGAAELGLAEAQYLLGEDLTRTKRDEKQKAEGVALMHKAASQGHLDAMEHLGRLYADGQGVVKDASKAVEWYRRAAVAGHTLAQYSLGMMYLDGNGVAKDRALAVKYFRDAAAKDYLPAIDRLKELGVSEKP